MKYAACIDKDPELFFPEKGDSNSGNQAILTCFSCTVRTECKDYKEFTGSTDGRGAGEYSKRGAKGA